MRFDPTYLDIELPLNSEDNTKCKTNVMREFYPDAEETIPSNAPEPRGKAVQINCFVDVDYAGNVITRRYQTEILIYLNMSPIFWFSKKQNTVESSTFSSEFVALRIAAENLISLRYKLRIFGILLESLAIFFYENEAV